MSDCQPTPGVHENFATLVSRYGEKPTQEGFDAIHRKYLTDCVQSRLAGSPVYASHGSAAAMFDVIAERLRQQEKEGWTPEHDDEHDEGQLAAAAGCYALHAHDDLSDRRYPDGPAWWPFDGKWWKPKSPRENLVRAAALIIAEIERINRAAGKDGAA